MSFSWSSLPPSLSPALFSLLGFKRLSGVCFVFVVFRFSSDCVLSLVVSFVSFVMTGVNRGGSSSSFGNGCDVEGLTGRESKTIVFEAGEGDAIVPQLNFSNSLVGRLCADKQPNGFFLIDVMKKAWSSRKNVTAREWKKNFFVFGFENAADRDWVLSQQPWHFDNYLFAVAPLDGSQQPSNVSISRCSFWLRTYDLPLHCMRTNIIRALGQKVGTVEDIDTHINYSGSFARLKVNLDITEPLLRGLTVAFEGKKLWIPLKYESLPIYCFNCGIIGHQSRKCDMHRSENKSSFEELRYGPWLKASPLTQSRAPAPGGMPHPLVRRNLLWEEAARANQNPSAQPSPQTSPIKVPTHPSAASDILPTSHKTNTEADYLSTQLKLVDIFPPRSPTHSNQLAPSSSYYDPKAITETHMQTLLSPQINQSPSTHDSTKNPLPSQSMQPFRSVNPATNSPQPMNISVLTHTFSATTIIQPTQSPPFSSSLFAPTTTNPQILQSETDHLADTRPGRKWKKQARLQSLNKLPPTNATLPEEGSSKRPFKLIDEMSDSEDSGVAPKKTKKLPGEFSCESNPTAEIASEQSRRVQ